MASASRSVIVQTLWTRWTKKSRGPTAAVRRYDTPERFDINLARLLGSEVVWHDIEFREPHFLPMEHYRERGLPADFRRVGLRIDAGELSVELFGVTRFHLVPGQSGHIVYNLSDDIQLDGWRDTEFHKVVLHVAFGLAPTPDLFKRPPDQSFVSLRNFT